jgi:5-methyltetrahydrofolate--homocysteine methyltransferase
VEGDLHDIGKNLVTVMWRGANVRVVDLGTNVPPQRFVEAAGEHAATAVGLSALLTTTMPAMEKTVEVLKVGHGGVQVLVGGAPLSADYARTIGADGFAPDAGAAVDVLLDLIAA